MIVICFFLPTADRRSRGEAPQVQRLLRTRDHPRGEVIAVEAVRAEVPASRRAKGIEVHSDLLVSGHRGNRGPEDLRQLEDATRAAGHGLHRGARHPPVQ